jgi:hypothetical protein
MYIAEIQLTAQVIQADCRKNNVFAPAVMNRGY